MSDSGKCSNLKKLKLQIQKIFGNLIVHNLLCTICRAHNRAHIGTIQKDSHDFPMEIRIPTVKLEIPGKGIFEIRNQNLCYIQVIVFDLSYLLVAAVGITMKKLWKI